MNIIYRKATQNDIELIAAMRVLLINEDSGLNASEKDVLFQNPEYRRMGIGRELVRLTVRTAIERGHTKITLSATEKGSALFERCGFVTIPNVGLTDMEYIGIK
jgi:Predicted acetyltransferase